MKTICYLLLFLLMPMTQVLAQTGRVVITGQVINRKADAPKTVNINVNDILLTDARRSVPIQTDGRFQTELDFTVGHVFNLTYRDFACLYAAPGDSIHLLIDDSQPTDADGHVTLSGRYGSFTPVYYQYTRHGDPLSNRLLSDMPNDTLPLDQQISIFTRTYQTACDSIDRYCQARQVNDHDRKLLHIDALYLLGDACCEYTGRTPQERRAFFEHPIFRMDDPDNLSNPVMYAVHLMAWQAAVEREDSVLVIHRAAKDTATYDHRLMELKLSLPKGVCRDMVLCTYLEEHCEIPLPPDTVFSMPAIYQKLKKQRRALAALDTTFIHFDCLGDSLTYYNKANGQTLPITTNDFFRYLHEQYPDKAIYLDIYGTWCIPCMEEMKHAPTLYERYAGQDIVFVDLCCKSSRDSWLKVARRLDCEHYLITGKLCERFQYECSLLGYPTYMILDRNGRFLTRRAPRPSERDKLFPLLDSILQPNH